MSDLLQLFSQRASRRDALIAAAGAMLFALTDPIGVAATPEPLPFPRRVSSPVIGTVAAMPPRRSVPAAPADNAPTATTAPAGTTITKTVAPATTTSTSTPIATPQVATTPTPHPAASVTMGVYIPDAAQNTSILDAFETMTGKQMKIVHWFQPWGYDNGTYTSVLDTNALRAVTARGATPLITWEAWGTVNGKDPSHLANISTGAFDTYIDSWAQGLKAFGQPVYLRLFHEMNFQGYPWAYGVNGNTATDLVTAWQYVHNRFTRIGATNVRWVWCPNPQNGLVTYRAMYPGDAYVDSFGIDLYNGGTQFDWGGWVTPDQALSASYVELQTLNTTKPVMLTETSSVELGGSKGNWITSLYESLPSLYPNIHAIVWFHDDWTVKATTDSRNLPAADWRVNTSPAALQAFSAL